MSLLVIKSWLDFCWRHVTVAVRRIALCLIGHGLEEALAHALVMYEVDVELSCRTIDANSVRL